MIVCVFLDFYGKTKKRSAIIRNNRNYLLENIQPDDELIDSLFSLNCITEEQSHFIQRQHSNRCKNAELLYFMRFFDETKSSNFVKCLRQNNHKTVARIIENGGGIKNKLYILVYYHHINKPHYNDDADKHLYSNYIKIVPRH